MSNLASNLNETENGADTDTNGEASNSKRCCVPPRPQTSPGNLKKKRGVKFAAGTIDNSNKKPLVQKGQLLQRKPINTNNIKKEHLAQLIQKKKECDRKAHEIVLRLIETQVEKEYLLDNAIRISQTHLDDVVEERKLAQLCGWILCDNSVNPENVPKQTYTIRGHKVYDITERKAYCDAKCYAKSVHFKAQLLTSPLWLRDMEENVTFGILEDSETNALHGLSVKLTSVQLSDDSENEDIEELTKNNTEINKDC